MTPRTVADAFGEDVADELARWAIDTLCHPDLSERHNKYAFAAKVPWSVIEDGRAALERAGIDWRELLANAKTRREAAIRGAS